MTQKKDLSNSNLQIWHMKREGTPLLECPRQEHGLSNAGQFMFLVITAANVLLETKTGEGNQKEEPKGANT